MAGKPNQHPCFSPTSTGRIFATLAPLVHGREDAHDRWDLINSYRRRDSHGLDGVVFYLSLILFLTSILTALQARETVLQAAALEAARAFVGYAGDKLRCTQSVSSHLLPSLLSSSLPSSISHSPAFCARVLPHIARLFHQVGGSELLRLHLLALLGGIRAEYAIMAAALELALSLQPVCVTRCVRRRSRRGREENQKRNRAEPCK